MSSMTESDVNNVKVGIVITCRYNSNRLPGKILMKIEGKEVLGYINERLLHVTSAKDIIVATSIEQDDDLIVDFCKSHRIKYYRGHKNDVAQRILECAVKHNFDYFVRICGDNIFTDYNLLDKMINIAIAGNYNFVSNLKGRTFPAGISIEILKTEFFRNIILRYKTSEQKEHVTLYLYDHELEIDSHYYFYNNICPEARSIKLALDDMNDLRFINKIIKEMDKDHTEYLMKDIYELSKKVSGRN
jgi:spore coat polysaccharide biosynthesis protein SpsF